MADNPGTDIVSWVTESSVMPLVAFAIASGVGISVLMLFWIRRKWGNGSRILFPVALSDFFGRICYGMGSWITSTKLPRHGSRYDYTALEADSNSQERMECEKRARQRAESACLHYLKFCPRYAFIQHLNDIGSRVGKHWFVVRDSSVKTERLLTLTPQSSNSPIVYNQITRRMILDLFLALQHPYIYPILDLEFAEANSDPNNAYIIVVLPFNNKGSLKDLIYKTCWHDEWSDKYSQRNRGLPLSQIQRLGRQILEALLFLREREYTYSFHLHSGNVILQNGVARLSGLENSLLGYSSRIQPVILHSSLLQVDPTSVDVVCFGHVLFEMTAGYELTEPEPTQANMLDVTHYPQVVQILDFIFKNRKRRIPSVEELLISDFFRSIDLREMRAASLPVLQVTLTSPSMALLTKIKEHQHQLICGKLKGNDDDPKPGPSGQQLSFSIKMHKNKSCEASMPPDINAITELIDDDDRDDGDIISNTGSENEVQIITRL